MAYIDWKESFSVQVKELDDDHKALVSAINTLHQALMENNVREAQKRTVDHMISYASNHFAAEEKYMLQFAFPDTRNTRRNTSNSLQRPLTCREEWIRPDWFCPWKSWLF